MPKSTNNLNDVIFSKNLGLVSFSSTSEITIDAPDLENIDANYVYNSYDPDESVIQAKLLNPDPVTGEMPSYVLLNWQPMSVIEDQDHLSHINLLDDTAATILPHETALNLLTYKSGKIIPESYFSNNRFMPFNFQDTGIDRKLEVISNSFVRQFADSTNAQVKKALKSEKQKLKDQFVGKSFAQQALMLADLLAGKDDGVSAGLFKIMGEITKQGEKFYTKNEIKETKSSLFLAMKGLSFKTKINMKFLSNILESSARDPANLYQDELRGSYGTKDSPLSHAKELQANFNSLYPDPDIINAVDYETILSEDQIIKYKTIEQSPNNASTEIRPKGYIIKRINVTPKSEMLLEEAIIIGDHKQSSFKDGNILYGQTYLYTIEAVYEAVLKGFATALDSSQLKVTFSIFVSTQQVKSSIVHCIETIPPGEPENLEFKWDYHKNSLFISWSFPLEAQRDIVKFQIFRRKTVNDSFELVKHFDFNDSKIKYEINPLEKYNKNVIEFTPGKPQTVWWDKSFTKHSKYIYAIVAHDAHGMKSNLSEQFEVSFDVFKNKLVTKKISDSAVPHVYPNFKMNNRLLEEAMFSSDFDKLNIYFDPEVLELADEDDNDLEFIVTEDITKVDVNESNKYKIHFLNLDLQKSDVLDIIIKVPAEQPPNLIDFQSLNVTVDPVTGEILLTDKTNNLTLDYIKDFLSKIDVNDGTNEGN